MIQLIVGLILAVIVNALRTAYEVKFMLDFLHAPLESFEIWRSAKRPNISLRSRLF